MNDIKGIIEDVEKSDLVSDKVIKEVIEIIGQEKWQEINDKKSDICTTTGELIITLKGIPELEKENAELRNNGFTVSAMTEQQLKVAIEKGEQLEKDFRICEKNADTYYDQLSKAKEIIKDQKELLDRVLSGAETLSDFAQNTLRKAEQFIREIEK